MWIVAEPFPARRTSGGGMMDEEIEVIARAFYETGDDARGWDREPETIKCLFREKASAAILEIDRVPVDDTARLSFLPVNSCYSHVFDGSVPSSVDPHVPAIVPRRQWATNAAPSGFMAVVSGRSIVFEFADQGFHRWVGRRRLIGRSAVEALPEWRSEGLIELISKAFRTGRTLTVRGLPVVCRLPVQGTRRDTRVDVVCTPVRGFDNALIGVMIEGREIESAGLPLQ
ncbi:nitrogen regulation protein NR(II) [Microvirga pudoricolor]|uniref:hypothetical protein n=1 Tax=Microvirga pudoricolor TaxID=2778729 RepID=UPI00194EAD84|nr:hypothetical protein [Microvirga pudoricolor]MBM6594522.1 hypothetical protein [Microvirga pudoricolor]